MKLYKELVKIGLPSCQDKNGNFIQKEVYKDMLIKGRDDITKFKDMDGVLKGQTIVCKLIDDFHFFYGKSKLYFIIFHHMIDIKSLI